MSESFDYIVLGVGGLGSAALYHLARHGVRAVGIEQFGIAHDLGSSHGDTRIIRTAYHEHSDYVPLVLRAHELWRQLETEARSLQDERLTLYQKNKLMLAGPPDGEVISGARKSASEHALQLDQLTLGEAHDRFPGFRFPAGFEVVCEENAGVLFVEECVRAHINCALSHGATLRTDETVLDWSSSGNTVRVQTNKSEYEAAGLIVTAGPWSASLLSQLDITIEVVRKPVFWFEASSNDYNADRGAPSFLFEMPTGVFYGFPAFDGNSVKLAEHSGGLAVSDPSNLERSILPDDLDRLLDFARSTMPGLKPQPVRHSVCMYSMTPDGHFIVDRHPAHDNVVVATGFSGHGFKFAGVLGEAVTALIVDGKTDHPIEFLGLDRAGLKP